jgi:hypothetical protein
MAKVQKFSSNECTHHRQNPLECIKFPCQCLVKDQRFRDLHHLHHQDRC